MIYVPTLGILGTSAEKLGMRKDAVDDSNPRPKRDNRPNRLRPHNPFIRQFGGAQRESRPLWLSGLRQVAVEKIDNHTC